MVKVGDIYAYIDTLAPYMTAEEWDNTGLSVGSMDDGVTKAGFALDLTSAIVSQAVKDGCDLIITHHPLIFEPLKNVEGDSCVYKLIENGIAHISAHTNFDIAPNGVNEQLISKLSLKVLYKVENECLYICSLESPMNTDSFADFAKRKLDAVIRYNRGAEMITKVAVCSGSGSDYLQLANEHGCKALVTGDGKHHAFIDANEMGISLICAGHFETEAFAMQELCDKIHNKFGIACEMLKQESPIITK
ncbi:MAG: Nif3-like dinuclear metal center hexameric protein [Clostridiales bacterium]|nr:Nif3-like dinuclear metal center hexameric protein [Clostridiales bacterium]